MSSPVDVKLGYSWRPKNGRIWDQLKICEILKILLHRGSNDGLLIVMPVLCIHATIVLINLKQRGYSSSPTSTQCPQDVLCISCERKPVRPFSVSYGYPIDGMFGSRKLVHTGMSYGCPSTNLGCEINRSFQILILISIRCPILITNVRLTSHPRLVPDWHP